MKTQTYPSLQPTHIQDSSNETQGEASPSIFMLALFPLLPWWLGQVPLRPVCRHVPYSEEYHPGLWYAVNMIFFCPSLLSPHPVSWQLKLWEPFSSIKGPQCLPQMKLAVQFLTLACPQKSMNASVPFTKKAAPSPISCSLLASFGPGLLAWVEI